MADHLCQLPDTDGRYPGDQWHCACGAAWEVDEFAHGDDDYYFDWYRLT